MLIPFFTIGVFQAFTLSQFGMVKHWFKDRDKDQGWLIKAFLNGLGGVATLIVFIDIITEKFWDGAWFILVLISVMMFIFSKISKHYQELAESLALPDVIEPMTPIKNHVLVLVQGVHAGTINAVRYAESISQILSTRRGELETVRDHLHGEAIKERYKAAQGDLLQRIRKFFRL